jgi:hypothetical protein
LTCDPTQRADVDAEYEPKAAAAKKSKPKAATAIGVCSLNKKDFGDRIKEALRLEKYDVQRMRINVRARVFLSSFFLRLMNSPEQLTMDVAFFRSFFGGHASITPAGACSVIIRFGSLIWYSCADFSQDSPVVVAELNNSQAGEVFGVSKIKNGNRMTTIHLQSMMVVFYPSKGKASVWLTV